MTVTIKVYPNKLDGTPGEVFNTTPDQTLNEWLLAEVPNYQPRDEQKFSAIINGQFTPVSQWDSYRFQPNDEIHLTVEAKDPATIAYAVIAVIAIGVSIHMANQIPDNYNTTTPDGSSIYDVNAQGNKPRLMGVIPEQAGLHKAFPDYVLMPHRRYENNEQWLYLMLAVGVGEYDITELSIGNTPISNYSGDMFHAIYGPGESSGDHPAAKNMYTSAEVGGSSGQSGLEIQGKVSAVVGGSADLDAFDFTTTYIRGYERITEGHEDWFALTEFPFEVGEILTVTKVFASNLGDYRILSKSRGILRVEKVDANNNADTSWTGFTDESKVVADITVKDGGGPGEYLGPFFACPKNETTTKIELDFKFPQGLGEIDDSGDYISQTVQIVVEWRDENAPSWESQTITYSDNTPDQLGFTEVINLASAIRPEVRVKRVTDAVDDSRIKDKIEWTSLKAELFTPDAYDDVTTIALKIKGTNSLASSAENKFNIISTRILPVFENGAWSEPKPTRDIAAFFAHVIKDCGHTDDVIPLDELQSLHETWNSREDYFDAIFDNDSTLFESLKRILAVGYTEPTLDYGQIVPVRDEPRTTFDHMYQPQNMLGDGLIREGSYHRAEEMDGIEVEYFDPVTWKSETVLCLLPEAADLGIRPKKLRAFGITDRTKAWRFGMRYRRDAYYRRNRYTFKTEMDALNSHYLSYVSLADDIPGYSQTGHVIGASGVTITLNKAVTFDGEGTHYLAVRKPDGRLSGPYMAVGVANSPHQLIIEQALDFIPDFSGRMEPPLFMFGKADNWSLPALVVDINPQGIDKVSVKAKNYAAEVYADDDNAPSA